MKSLTHTGSDSNMRGASSPDSMLEIKEKSHWGIDFFDRENPRSLFNIVPGFFQDAMKKVPKDLTLLTEAELLTKLRGAKKHSPELDMMRYSFWYEYDRAQSTLRKMNMTNVFGSVCSMTYFRNRVVTDPMKVAYLIMPMAEYELTVKQLMMFGLNQLRDILMLPHVDDKGNPNPRMAEVKVKIVQDLITRDRGSVVHKIESRNMNVNVDMQAPQVEDLREVERQLAELEGEVLDEVIEVEPGK